MQVKIHFISEEVKKMYASAGVMEAKSSGFDLINVEELKFTKENPFLLVNLGVVIQLPENYHALLIPRSSTFKNYRLIQTNHVGLIDESYCGIKDVWQFPALWIHEGKESLSIPAGTRLCQFIIQPRHDILFFNPDTKEINSFIPSENSRGGIGSTNKK